MSIKHFLPLILLSLPAVAPPSALAQSGVWTEPARVTDMGPDLDRNFDAREPDIAFNNARNEYLVVWEGTDQRSGLAPDETEIYGQRVNAGNGVLVGEKAFRISSLGPDGTANFDARDPSVSFNPVRNEYLVVWSGDDNKGQLVEGEFEIFAQRINAATGALIGSQNIRVSDMGPDGNRSYDAMSPAVTYNTTDDLYLVVWRGEDGVAASPAGEFEIYGQLLDGATASQLGENDFRISTMGPQNNANYDAYDPAVAYNTTDNEFLVVWHGDDDSGALVDEELEVYAQRLEGGSGALIGPSPVRVSDSGDSGNVSRSAIQPRLAWNRDQDEYLVVWSADDSLDGRPSGEFEIYGQLLTAAGTETGANDFLISNNGPLGNAEFDADEPAIVYHGAAHQFVVTWHGDQGVDGEFEIWSQRLDGPTLTPLGQPGQRLTHAGPDNSLLYDSRRAVIAEDVTGGRVFMALELEDEAPDQAEGEFEIYTASLGSSAFKVQDGISGSWFDLAHDGEGWVVELIDEERAVVYWFTYDADVPVQAWVLGIGSVVDNRVVMSEVAYPSGGIFGPDFDPTTVHYDPWGTFVIEFETCNAAGMNYNSSIESFGAGSQSPVRLSSLAGLACPGPTPVPEAMASLSGSWFDPSHDGEGWVLQYLGNNRVVLYWFTYDSEGNQAWFIGVGTSNGTVATFDDVLISSGTRFGENFNPQAVVLEHWGTVTFTMTGCNDLLVDYASVDASYGSGQLHAKRLVTPKGLQCN